MKKIKILEMIDKPFMGGGQRHLVSLATSLDKKRFQVYVASEGGGPLEEALSKEEIKHYQIPIQKKISRKTLVHLIPIFQENSFDIIHTHGGVAGLYGRWTAKKAGIPVLIHTLHGIHYLHYRNPAVKWSSIWLERIFSKFTTALIFVSEADRKMGSKFRLAAEEKQHMIHNGIDFSLASSLQMSKTETAAVKRELSIPTESLIIGTIARLHRQKGLPYLIKAMACIQKEAPEAKLIIIGDGPEKNRLHRAVHRLGIEDRVYFLGERHDASRLLSLFDIFALPSLWEGHPYVLMEAAALKLPVAATRIDGVKEMIEHQKSGLLVSPRDPDELALALLRLLKDREFSSGLGKALFKSASRSFPLSKMIERTQDLYLKLHSEAKSVFRAD